MRAKMNNVSANSHSLSVSLHLGGICSAKAANSGWFGGLFNKLTLKPKNQMILPDDKNPAVSSISCVVRMCHPNCFNVVVCSLFSGRVSSQIVWDADKKKWISSDGGAEEEEQFRPPPKMSDMMGGGGPAGPPAVHFAPQPAGVQPEMPVHAQQHQQPPSFGNPMSYATPESGPASEQSDAPAPVPVTPLPVDAPAAAAVAAAPNPARMPNLQSNMFKMQRNRSNYDLFGFSDLVTVLFTPHMISQSPPPPHSESSPEEIVRGRVQSVRCSVEAAGNRPDGAAVAGHHADDRLLHTGRTDRCRRSAEAVRRGK